MTLYKEAKVFNYDDMPEDIQEAFREYTKIQDKWTLVEWPMPLIVGKFPGSKSPEYKTVMLWLIQNGATEFDKIIIQIDY